MATTQVPWYSAWFNSPYYHILYSNRNQHEADHFIDQLTHQIGLPEGSRALDLACGSGRHARKLHGNGFLVTGIDLSENSIAEANKLATDGLEFYVQDMRQLFWTEHFHLVVNLFTSFGYFNSEADDRRVMHSVFDALLPGGMFVIDFLNLERAMICMVPTQVIERDGIRFNIEKKVQQGVIVKDIEVIDGAFTEHFQERLDALSPETLTNYLLNAGFEIAATYGDYALGPFDSATSARFIAIAQKPNR